MVNPPLTNLANVPPLPVADRHAHAAVLIALLSAILSGRWVRSNYHTFLALGKGALRTIMAPLEDQIALPLLPAPQTTI